MIGATDVPEYHTPTERCPTGCEGEWETCWQCGGEGGWHDCGEDCCACLDEEEVTRACDNCSGEGGYVICAAAR